MIFAAVDIGGTKVKYGIVEDKGRIIFKDSMDTLPERGSTDLLKRIEERLMDLKRSHPFVGIAISTAGQVNFREGSISYATDLIPGWIGTNIRAYFEGSFSLPVVVENDVNCAAMGELWQGAAKGRNSFICLTLGTGIGGGIVLGGELFRGENYAAGEFGHIKISENGRRCRCGSTGCYEAHASTDALVSQLKEITGSGDLDGRLIFELEKKGVEPYKEEVERWIGYIADGITNISVSFNPSLIIVGGGISAQGDYLAGRIRDSLSKKIMPSFLAGMEIRMATSGNDAGMLGAAYLLMRKLETLND